MFFEHCPLDSVAAGQQFSTSLKMGDETIMTKTSQHVGPISSGRPGEGAAFAPGMAVSVLTAAALAATGAFAGGALLTQTVLVPYWRSMAPAAFFEYFGTYGPLTGATLFPVEIAATVLLGIVLYAALRGRSSGRFAWAVAWLCMAGTVLLLPVYFVEANTALLAAKTSPAGLEADLRSWYTWNWLRTGLAFLAVVAGVYAAGCRNPAGRNPAGARRAVTS